MNKLISDKIAIGDETQNTEHKSLGSILAVARSKKKLSQEDIAQNLNLKVSVIAAIEKDQPIVDIPVAYIRGYQRSYIRYLGLDESQLLGAVSPMKENVVLQTDAGHLNSFDAYNQRRLIFKLIARVVVLLFIIALSLILWPKVSSVFKDDTPVLQLSDVAQNEEFKDLNSEAEVLQTSVSQVPVNQVKIPKSNDTETLLLESIKNEQTTGMFENSPLQILLPDSNKDIETGSEAQSLMLSPINEDQTNILPVKTKITFISNGESWLEVTDAEKNRLYSKILKLDRVSLSGTLPLSVATGNVQVLRLMLDNGVQQKVDIYKNSRAVAKFIVDKDTGGKLKFTAIVN